MQGFELLRTCEACGNTNPQAIEWLYPIITHDVLRCRLCGFVYVNNPELNYPSMKTFCDIGKVRSHHMFREILIDLAKRHFALLLNRFLIDKGSTFLDFGCGNGYFLGVVKEQGMSGLGIEINKATVEYAEDNLGVKVIAESPSYPSLAGKKFDVVTLWAVIEHLPKPKAILELLKNYMHINSILVLDTPTEDSLFRKTIHLVNKIFHSKLFVTSLYSDRIGHHTQCFGRKSITTLLEQCGFELIDTEDSTYGYRYMVQYPRFELSQIGNYVKRFPILCGYIVNQFVGHKNHVIIYAKLKDQASQ